MYPAVFLPQSLKTQEWISSTFQQQSVHLLREIDAFPHKTRETAETCAQKGTELYE